ATGLLCWIATAALIPILRRQDLLDHPNARSSHRIPTPRGGGIAVTGAVLLAWLLLYWTGSVTAGLISVSLGAGVLAAVSWVDDLRGLSPGIRLLAQLIAVTLGIFTLPEAHNWLEAWLGPALYFAGLGALWIWWINLFNFMDGIDGLAASEGAAGGGGGLLVAEVGG